MDVCIICNEPLNSSKTVIVSKKGIETLIKASHSRQDKKWLFFENKTTIEMHEKCRRNYTRATSIKASSTADISNTAGSSNTLSVSLRRSTAKEFDFKNDCLFCDHKCDGKFKKRPNKKNVKFSTVSTIEIKETILKHSLNRNDEWGHKVRQRIESEIDLVASEARYHPSCYASFTHKYTMEKGRPLDSKNIELFNKLCDYLNETKEMICQFTMSDIMLKMKEFSNDDTELWSSKYLKKKILDYYQDEVVVLEKERQPAIFCFKGSNKKMLQEMLNNKTLTDSDKRKEIILACAEILREDIRSTFNILDEYPEASEISDGGVKGIPDTLLLFLTTLFGGDTQQIKKLSIANALISAVRPRSYISPILFSTGVHMHRKYGSKNLIHLLAALGFSVPYKEVIKFEASAVSNSEYQLSEQAYHQFVFDNADFNVKTLDGYETFHSMGGIVCVSPDSEIAFPSKIARPKALPKANETGKFGVLPLVPYKKTRMGLKSIIVKELNSDFPEEKLRQLKLHNCLWMASYLCRLERKPCWNGYMSATVTGEFKVSCVLPVPFINLDPGNLTTIHSALQFAANQAKRQGQNNIFVTFDQPLYIKAADIVAAAEENSILKCVIVRLGGFHMLMSFMGSVGYLMTESGLEELWHIIYAKNSIPAMINGHSFSRALRAHFLTQLTLSLILLKSWPVYDSVRVTIEILHSNFETHLLGTPIETILNELCIKLKSESLKSRTAKLWAQYWDLVELMKMFIRAERSGDFDLHLYCVRKMIPIFHATGHLPYAKSSHLYLQQMETISISMLPEEYQKFLNFFTIRRTGNKFWSGVWTDMSIEQVLMRSLKAEGGLTHGRGLTDSTLAKWVSSMPECSKISDAIENFSGVKATYSEQHVELRQSREQRDVKDINKLLEWVNLHSPFDRNTTELVSISSGIVATKEINCDAAQEIGESIVHNLTGENFYDLKLKRSSKVKNFSFLNKTIKLYNQSSSVNPSQLFNRIICTYKSQEDLKKCFEHELAPYPLALFENGLLQKTKKSALLGFFDKKCAPLDSIPENSVFVLDGGFLIHKIIWQFPSTYGNIYIQYVNYIKYNYGKNTTVVFDGYDSYLSTKEHEQLRRYSKTSCLDILFSEKTTATVNQSQFFSNKNNKKRFILQLSQYLKSAGIQVVQAEGDADRIMVDKALELRTSETSVTLVGEDTDLMVLLIFKSKMDKVYMLRPGNSSKPHKVTDIKQLQEKLGPMRSAILFCHAISGCDTTSALYKKGKLSSFRLLEKNKDLQEKVGIFLQPNAEKNAVIKTGEDFLMSLYGANKSTKNLNELRFLKFNFNTARQSLNKNIELACLPPTSDAACYHSLRVYHQIQEWMGNLISPTTWGWKKQGEVIQPIQTDKPIAPEFILKLIFCNCKTDCRKLCSCRKANLNCSNLCGQCQGNACSNCFQEYEDVLLEDNV